MRSIMAVYAYRGFDAKGKAISGERDVDSVRTLRVQLKKEGIFVNYLEEKSAQASAIEHNKSFFKKNLSGGISSQQLAIATRQLATLVGASIPLVDALSALVEQVDHPLLRSTLSFIKQRVNEGGSLGDAMADHPRVFSPLFINMIRAGESSGALDVVLNRLADFTENQAKIKSKLIASMFYPMIMMFMAIGVVSLMMIVVVPKIVRIFENQKASLPLPTVVVMAISNVLQDYGLYMLLGLILFIYWFSRYKKTEKGKQKVDAWLLKMPVFGNLIRMLAVARFSRTLATLLESGVQLLVALDIVKNIVNNYVLTQAIETARLSIQEGESISAPLKRSLQFPPIVTHMIAIGEKSGQLEPMLIKIADAYDTEAESRILAMTSILEPVIIIMMGGVVGLIVFSIILPMLQMSSFAK